MHAIVVLALALAVMPATAAVAAPGDLDPTFGDGGTVTTEFPGWALAEGMAIQADGKIVAVGRAGSDDVMFGLARYDPDGTLDTTFGAGGSVTTNFTPRFDIAYAVAIQVDGKIVAAGSDGRGRFALARYDAAGSLDPAFGGDGLVTTDFPDGGQANALAIGGGGRMVAAGSDGNGRFALARYRQDGSLDPTFGRGGKVLTDFPSGYESIADIDIQADGRIVAVGTAMCPFSCSRLALARYRRDGTLDASFGREGKVTTDLTGGWDEAKGVAIQADGKIVAAGTAGYCCEWTGNFALVRYNADGTLDGTFGGNGKVITDFSTSGDSADAVAVQADGKIVAAGSAGYDGGSAAFAVARYNPNGTLDSTFGGDGKVTTTFTGGNDVAKAVAVQVDGKIVATGSAGLDVGMFALARYLG